MVKKIFRGFCVLVATLCILTTVHIAEAHNSAVSGWPEGTPYTNWYPGWVTWWGHTSLNPSSVHWHTIGYVVSPYTVGETYNLATVTNTGQYQTYWESTGGWVANDYACTERGKVDSEYRFSQATLLQTAADNGWLATGASNITLYMNPIIQGRNGKGAAIPGYSEIRDVSTWAAFARAYGFTYKSEGHYQKYYNKWFTINVPNTWVHVEYRDAKTGQLMSKLGGSARASVDGCVWEEDTHCYISRLANSDVTYPLRKKLIRTTDGKTYVLVGSKVIYADCTVGYDPNRILKLYDDFGSYGDTAGTGTLQHSIYYRLGAKDQQNGVIVGDTQYTINDDGAIALGSVSLNASGTSYNNSLFDYLQGKSFRTPADFRLGPNGLYSGTSTWVEYFYTELRPNFKLYWNKQFSYKDSTGADHSRTTAVSQLTYDVYSQNFKGHVNEDSTGTATQTFTGERGVSDDSGYSNRYYVYDARMLYGNQNSAWYGNGNKNTESSQGLRYEMDDYYGSPTYDQAVVTCPFCGARVARWHIAKCANVSTLKNNEQLQVRYRVKPPQIELYYVKQDDGTYKLWRKSSGGKELGTGYGLTDFTFRESGAVADASFNYQYKFDDHTIYNLASVRVYRLAGQNSVKYYNGDIDAWVDGQSTVKPLNSVAAEFIYGGNGSAGSGSSTGNSVNIDLSKYKENADKTFKLRATMDARPVVFIGVYEQQPVLEVRSYYYYNTADDQDVLNFNLDTDENNKKVLLSTSKTYKTLLPANWNGSSVPANTTYDTSAGKVALYKLDGLDDQASINFDSGSVSVQLLKLGQRHKEEVPTSWSASAGEVGLTLARPASVNLGTLRHWCDSWYDNASWRMRVYNYNLLVKVYGPKTPDLTVVKYFNTEYPFTGNGVSYERMGEAKNFYTAFGFDGLLPYTFAEKEFYTYQQEELSTTLSNTGVVQIPIADMKGYSPVLPKKILDLESTPTRAPEDTFEYHWLNNINWSKSNPDSAELPKNPLVTKIDPSRAEDVATTTFIGIYKADKAYTKVMYVRKADGSYTLVDVPVTTELNVNTKKILVGFKEYISFEGELYQLVNVGDNVSDSSIWGIPNLPAATKKLAGFTWHVGTADEKGELLPANELSVTRNGDVVVNSAESVADGISEAVGNNVEHRVFQKKLVVCGVYVAVGKEGSQDPFETRDEYQTFEQFVPESECDDSAAIKMIPSAVAFKASIINNQKYSSDVYDAEKSIPSSEYLKTTSTVPQYLANGAFGKRIVSKDYNLYSYKTKNYAYQYKDELGNLVTVYKGVIFSDIIPVNRTNYYWYLAGANVYVPKDVTVYNDALPDTTLLDGTPYVKMYSTNNPSDTDTLGFTRVQDGGIAILDYDDADLAIDHGLTEGEISLFGDAESGKASVEDAIKVDAQEWNKEENKVERKSEAENQIGNMTATNATVTFCNGEPAKVKDEKTGEMVDNANTFVLLQRTDYSEIVPDPINPPMADQTEAGVFDSDNSEETSMLQIPEKESNGEKESLSTVHYTLKYTSNGTIPYRREGAIETGTDLVFGVFINDVIVHTPVYCDISIEQENKFDQRISVSGNKQLVLDMQFDMGVTTTGQHIALPGYGYKDYSRYNEKIAGNPVVQVKFPFPVFGYRLSEENGELKKQLAYFRENTWITSVVGENTFILPAWAGETDAVAVRARSVAINARSEEGAAEPFNYLDKIEFTANTQRENYVAYGENTVELTGRVYGAKIIDVTDYPTWESVFRTKGLLNGFSYDSGIANQNGFLKDSNAKFTVPLVNGSHPKYANIGVLKTGYKIRFILETVGEMDDTNDSITIQPKFYYVDKDTGEYYSIDGKRAEVDVYYDETINGTKHEKVKVGSDLDKLNTKYLSLSSKFDVDSSELKTTAKLLGYSDVEKFTQKESAAYTFAHLDLGINLRTFVGNHHDTILNDGSTVNLYNAVKNAYPNPEQFSKELGNSVIRSVQQWYGMYYLPANVYVVPKGVAVSDENLLKNGYLVINFEITTSNGGIQHLAYDASKYQIDVPVEAEGDDDVAPENGIIGNNSGKCNMWTIEQFVNTKIDSTGVKFKFEDGDFILYDLTKSGADDYSSGGTH